MIRAASLALLIITACFVAGQVRAQPATEPPTIPVGHDAFLQWDRWPYLRIGVRAYMKSTFDRRGGNHFADSGHFLRQTADGLNVALDETGPGILWFVRHNHWHGSPWHYSVDGRRTIVEETSTANPLDPVPGSVFMPEHLFPPGLTYTWSETNGADLSWVPIPFQQRLQLSYGRARYGTGYFIFWKLMSGIDHLSRPLESWSDDAAPPGEVLELLGRSGTDIAPRGDAVTENRGTLSLAPYETKLLWRSEDAPASIRRVAFRVPEEGANLLAEARLRIHWDGREEPSVDAPLGLFFGTATLRHEPDQEYIVKAFPMTVRRSGGSLLFATYFPMPFHESARIELAERTGQTIEGIEWQIRHQPYAGAPNEVGWFHATYRDFPAPQAGHDLELLDTRDVEGGGPWTGHLVGTTFVFTRRGNLRTLEGDPRFYFDDSRSPQGQGTGSEEWGGGGDYWGGRTMTLPFVGHPVGKPRNEARNPEDLIHSAYRFLLSDLMPFGRNARLTLEHGGKNETREHYSTVTYWYGLDEPSLVLSDEFDVGNVDDERRHAYSSLDASPVDTLSSRYEWGPDSADMPGGEGEMEVFMPVADDGRRTTGRSEFTLQLQPDNLGVLLRRRLDLAYPNQRARVWVADASPGTEGARDGAAAEADWEEAGIWYTAGGRTTVFADPLALPKAERTAHPELAAPARIVWRSERRWREAEFLIPRRLTAGRTAIRIRIEHLPVGFPLFPGHPVPEEAWTEYRYWAYSIVMPGAVTSSGSAFERR